MKIPLTFDDIHQSLQSFQQQYGGRCQLAQGETFLLMPTRFGEGYLRGISLREGLELFIYEYRLNCDLILDFQKLALNNSFVNLTFCLSGRCSGFMPGIDHKLDIHGQQTSLSTVPYAAGTVEFFGGQQISGVELVMSPQFARGFLADRLSAMPFTWQQALKAAALEPSYHLTKLSPEISYILQQVFNCPYQGTLRQLYLEGKSLELIALYFSAVTGAVEAPSGQLKRDELDRLHQAKQIISQQMLDPPSPAALAQQVGLSERKLQKGFQQLFGTTVFGLLHDYRMEQARQMLEKGKMSVGAIALAVGISHRGYFSTVFKRKFGSTPSVYQKRFTR
ncbi:MAG: AraC family transcriptional regulator [Cyanobacteria bacterium J06650_10]